MKKTMSRLGFTLIELLIVITIIGILAVVMLPNIMGSTEKARDAARKADVGNIVEAVEAARLAGVVSFGTAPTKDDGSIQIGNGCVNDALADKEFTPSLAGGIIPKDPGDKGPTSSGTCANNYYITNIGLATGFKYAVVAKVEALANANVDCSTLAGNWIAPAAGSTIDKWCYGTRMQ